MLALYATGLILVFLLIPGFLFRSVFSFFLPLRKFERTRSEEIAFAAKICAAPLLLAVLQVCALGFFLHHPLPTHSGLAPFASNVEILLRDGVSEKHLEDDLGWRRFTDAAGQVFPVVGNFLIWYYVWLMLEAFALGVLSSRFGSLRQRRGWRWILEKMLLPAISEWHVLLTTFAFPKNSDRVPVADVLTADDHLYHGTVENYYLDRSGKLSGVLLAGAYRFDRAGYLRARQAGAVPQRQPFWKEIPGKNVYVFADRITNLNLGYEQQLAIRLKKLLRLDPTAKLDIQ